MASRERCIMMYCNNCGKQIPEGSKFCPECGSRITSPVVENQGQYEEEDRSYSSSRNIEKKKPKRRRLLKILFVILCLFAAILLYVTRGLYIYSTITYKSTDKLTKQDQKEFEELFQGKYMLCLNDEYIVIDPLDGLGFSDTSIKEHEEDLGKYEFSISGNYAYIEITFSTSKDYIIVSFIKPTLQERIYFITKYII